MFNFTPQFLYIEETTTVPTGQEVWRAPKPGIEPGRAGGSLDTILTKQSRLPVVFKSSHPPKY